MALCFGLLVLGTLAGIFTAYYVEIVGTASQQLDDYAQRTSKRLLYIHAQYGEVGLRQEIDRLLSDGIDSHSEVLVLQDRQGSLHAGNALADLRRVHAGETLQDVPFEQEHRSFIGRVQVTALTPQLWLLAGSDVLPLSDIRDRYLKATAMALVLVLGLALAAAIAFRRLMDQRAAQLRRAMRHAGAGNLHFRLPQSRHRDEFSLLEHDINTMMEQLEQLVHGIRHVSNMVAHNLRTPLNRALHHVQQAMHAPAEQRTAQLEHVQNELQQLSRLFAKLLRLAEVESGVAPQHFAPLALDEVLHQVLEFYAPMFEDQQVRLRTELQAQALVVGDSHLLANALSNLLDNFLKYGRGAEGWQLDIYLHVQAQEVLLHLRDHGPGVAPAELVRMGQHFFRAAAHQQLPGHGIGLASVQAIVQLHGGRILWQRAEPGLAIDLRLPRAPIGSMGA